MKVNDFNADLEYSFKQSDNDMFNNLYKKVFLDLLEIKEVGDLFTQKKGIDKIIILKSGKKILVDEKKRRKDFGDILLEEYSDFDRKKKGWMGRGKYTDYIVYAIMPSRKIYLFPFVLLQNAFRTNYKNWLEYYGRIFAYNKNYKTSSIPIPTNILKEAINKEMQIA